MRIRSFYFVHNTNNQFLVFCECNKQKIDAADMEMFVTVKVAADCFFQIV